MFAAYAVRSLCECTSAQRMRHTGEYLCSVEPWFAWMRIAEATWKELHDFKREVTKRDTEQPETPINRPRVS